MSNNFLPSSVTATTSWQNLGTLLASAGFTDITNNSVTGAEGYIHNNDTAVNLYIGFGSVAPTYYSTVGPKSAILFDAGANVNQIWIQSASSTVAVDFVEGASAYVPPLVNGVIGTITATTNVVPKADASGNLVASSISDDASTVSIAEPTTVTGKVLSTGTTPIFETNNGQTNTGYLNLKGKTSGALKLLPTDASGQTITMTNLAQTVGAGTITIPDLAGASVVPTYNSLTQTLTNKTLTAPVMTTPTLGVASATSVATSAASPLLLTNGQLVSVALTSQTVGATTLTIPDFASVVDEFVFKTKSVTMSNKTFVAPVLGVATGTSLAVTGLLTSSSPTAGIGYVTGAGGAVTQSTDKSTTVASNTLTTAITLNNAALNAGVTVSFTFTNTTIAATDTVICTHQSAGTSAAYTVNAFPGAGSAVVSVRNNTAGNLSEAIVLRVTVIKSVSA